MPKSYWATIIKLLDAVLLLYAGIIVLILVSGGFSFVVFGNLVSASSPNEQSLMFGGVLLLRRWLARQQTWEEIPVIRIIVSGIHHVRIWFPFSPQTWAWLLAGGYAVIMSGVTILRHAAYQSNAYDLGIFDQVLWNTVHGNMLYSSILGRHFFGEHFSPILILIAQLYRVAAHPSVLLVFQSVALASGALPVYWLAKQKLGSPTFAAFFVWLYVGYQPLRNINLFDFHPVALVTPLLLFAFWFLDQRRYFWFGVFLLAALSCKEEIATIVFIFGIYIGLVHKKRLTGGLLALSGVAIFFVDIWVIIPYYRNAPFAFVERYSYLGHSIPEIVQTLVRRPLYVAQHVFIKKKVEYFFEVFGPVGLLSFLSPSHVLLATPTFFQNILSNSPPQYSIHYQYAAPLTSFVFVSAIHGLRNVLNSASLRRHVRLPIDRGAALRILVALLCWCSIMFFGHSFPYYFREYPLTPHVRLTREFLLNIPPQVSVSTQDTIVPHLSLRSKIYGFPVIGDAEYVVLDTAASTVPLSQEQYRQDVERLLRGDQYGVVLMQDTLLLLKRGTSQEQNAQALERLWK